MFDFFRRKPRQARAAPARPAPGHDIPDALWHGTLTRYAFLAALPPTDLERLRTLSRLFLKTKEFHGTQGLVITDAMAVAIAAQACLPLLYMGQSLKPPVPPERVLGWYDDFVGIVVHPREVLARRETVDDTGVVHHYNEVLSGEAMERGPVMLNWRDVRDAGDSAAAGYNVVIHEFVHKMDLRDGRPDGCPPLAAGFMGQPTTRAAREAWRRVLQPEFEKFREAVIRAERFGAEAPWLDAYGAEAIDEFLAVACEAYFVNRERFAQDFKPLVSLFDAFFRR